MVNFVKKHEQPFLSYLQDMIHFSETTVRKYLAETPVTKHIFQISLDLSVHSLIILVSAACQLVSVYM